MSKTNNIKWREPDLETLARKVKNFNAKLTRLEKKEPAIAEYLPERLSVREIKHEIGSRSEFNRTIASVDRFIHKRDAADLITSKSGNTVTRWEKKEVGIKVSILNRARTRERTFAENLPVFSEGKPLGLKRGEMGSERMNELKPKKYNFDAIKPGKEWDKFKEGVEKQIAPKYRNSLKERFKENYIKALSNVFGAEAKDLIDMIQTIPAEKVVKTMYADQEASITFTYDPLETSFKLEVLTDIWTGTTA